jgi:hypothetical protein
MTQRSLIDRDNLDLFIYRIKFLIWNRAKEQIILRGIEISLNNTYEY